MVEKLHEEYKNRHEVAAAVEGEITWLDSQLNDEARYSDPGFLPLAVQIKNHLQHVSYDFKIAADSADFPYELEHALPYPEIATKRALKKAAMLHSYDAASGQAKAKDYEVLEEGYKSEAIEAQNATMQRLLAEPFELYQDFEARRSIDGMNASFPEFGDCLRGLYYDLLQKTEVQEACQASPLVEWMRAHVVDDVRSALQSANFPYTETLNLIEDTMAFFDVSHRTLHPDAPDLYHTARFEYDWHHLPHAEDYFLLPSMASITAFDLIKNRGVPIGIVGVTTDPLRVDGKFLQTPYEFFHHDVNHTRRLRDETNLAVEREGMTPERYAEDATRLIHDVLLPALDVVNITDEAEYDRRIAMRMILFEILHEDAYDASRDTIEEAIMRDPTERMPFEQVVDGTTVEHFMSERATVLAHVFRKLSGDFYDLLDQRSNSLGSDLVRNRNAIAQGAAELYRLVSDDPISEEDLLETCYQLVSTDENFSDAFLGNMAGIIALNGAGENRLKLGVVKPLGVTAAVRKAKTYREKVHTLFGYSALDYEDPERLLATIEEDLKGFDPDETAIAIGATPYGIGRAYPVAKDLGFMTLGIVASTAVGRSEECSPGVDELIVVKDKGWGGHKYTTSSKGQLAKTTRVFVGASDSIAAYGGGNITAVSIEEMRRRGKPVSFIPFDMNHRIARMLDVQKGGNGDIDFRGPAYAKWEELS